MTIEQKREQVREQYLNFHANKKLAVWKSVPVVQPVADIADFKNVWVWSDLHFGHKNIIPYSERPFPDVETMDATLITNFNEKVSVDDMSIWVGDVTFYDEMKSRKILYRLNGYKVLIVGNHDFYHGKLKHMAFDEVHITYVLPVDDSYLVFSHYPFEVAYPDVNVHGHEHIKKQNIYTGHDAQGHYNVNCEFHNYTPINLNEIKEQARERISSYVKTKTRW
jgi:calcineurin-like phosphoesterase family protein